MKIRCDQRFCIYQTEEFGCQLRVLHINGSGSCDDCINLELDEARRIRLKERTKEKLTKA